MRHRLVGTYLALLTLKVAVVRLLANEEHVGSVAAIELADNGRVHETAIKRGAKPLPRLARNSASSGGRTA